MDSLLRVFLDVVPKSTNVLQKALGLGGGTSGGEPGKATARSEDTAKYLQDITDGFSKMHKELAAFDVALRPDLVKKQVDLEQKLSLARGQLDLAKITASMKPETITKMVELETKLDKAREKQSKALAKERREQTFGKGISGLILSKLPGAQRGAKIGEKLGIGTKAGAGLGAAAGGIGALLGVSGAVFAAGMASVGARSPATVEKFELALQDTAAVIGDTFVPVMELSTEGIRLFGDVLASVMPSAEETRATMMPLFEMFGDLRETIAPLVPTIHTLVKFGFELWIDQIGIAVSVFEILVETVKAVIGEFGLLQNGVRLNSSRGFAATSASFTSGEQRGKAAYAAAFAAGRTQVSSMHVAQSSNGHLAAIRQTTGEILTFIRNTTEAGSQARTVARNAFPTLEAARVGWSWLAS